ncbi:hypothetical protein V3C99_011212 [Haemonchus contortus]
MRTIVFFTLILSGVTAQVNLGQFSLHPRQNGGWNMGMSQGANIFGFGGHRALGIAGNDGGVGLSGTDNAIVANERVGVDSGLSAGRNGLDLGSLLQFGNNPNPVHPGGQLGSFLDNVRNFFASLVPSPLPLPPPQPPALPPLGATSGWGQGGGLPGLPQRIGTEGGVGPDGFLPRPWETEETVKPVDGDSRRSSRVSTEPLEEQFATLLPESRETEWSMQTTEEPNPFQRNTDRPRQLPGMVRMPAPPDE